MSRNQVLGAETPHHRAYAGLTQDIVRFAGNLLAGRAIGTSGRQP